MYHEPIVTAELAKEHGLSAEEYERILGILGRVPTYTELGIYSVMWSEHCSYKNSIAVLKTLPRSGKRLLVGAGEENAGLVDIGDGLAIAFKIESHNHPSAVEPYQGAATGVGGILRDIFTMGARPIAALNSLRFGELTHDRSRHLFKHAVKGIGDYGNSFGVPTIAGEVYFDRCYRANCLINAMAVGIVEHGKTASASAGAPGGAVLIVGSSTGKDGIHGATFASEEISSKSESKRPSVQVGDPFTEKLLLEATLEAINAGLVVGIQDMGAAGLTCSSTEMSAKAGVGMRINLDKVPLRDHTMNSYEIMLSESQERMLVIVQPENVAAIKKIFDKWDLDCEQIGEVIEGGTVEVYHHGTLEASVPAKTLVLGGDAPVYYRDSKEPAYLQQVHAFNPDDLPPCGDYNTVLLDLLASPNIASKRWVYEQYDSMVQDNTIDKVVNDAAVIRIKNTRKAIALKTDCNGRYVYLNPRRGAQMAVAEAARNVICSGAKPIAITNCLNFGNPYDPEVYWQFKEAATGMAEACVAFDTPVTGGNVSFYNEAPETSVYPTPVIGMLGVIEDIDHITQSVFSNAGDDIILLGKNRAEIGGSEYLFYRNQSVRGDAPFFDLEYEKRLQELCLDLIKAGYVESMHDTAEGGLAVALAECCFGLKANFGAQIAIEYGNLRRDFALFGESQSRAILTCKPDKTGTILAMAKNGSIDAMKLGVVTENGILKIGTEIELDIAEARKRYENSIASYME